MPTQEQKFKVVNIIDPCLCIQCQHAHIADVFFRDGSSRKMFHCTRLDCDNWGEIGPELKARREAA